MRVEPRVPVVHRRRGGDPEAAEHQAGPEEIPRDRPDTKDGEMKPVNGTVASERARGRVAERRSGTDRGTPGREAEAVPRSDSGHLIRSDRENLFRFMCMMRAA